MSKSKLSKLKETQRSANNKNFGQTRVDMGDYKKLQEENAILQTSVFEVEIEDVKLSSDRNKLQEEISSLVEKMHVNIWLIGQRLYKIEQERLFEPEYKSMREYCDLNLNIPPSFRSYAKRVYQAFDYVHAREHGSKLRLLLRMIPKESLETLKEQHHIELPSEVKSALSWMDENKPSYRQVEAYVKENFPENTQEKHEDPSRFHVGSKKITIEIDQFKEKYLKDKFTKELEGLVNKLIEKYSNR